MTRYRNKRTDQVLDVGYDIRAYGAEWVRERKDYGCPLRIWHKPADALNVYTIMPPRSRRAMLRWQRPDGSWSGLCWAFSQGGKTDATAGPHLGKRIHWRELPPTVQRFVRQSEFGEYCPKETP